MQIKSNAGYLGRSQIAAVMVAMILGSFGIGTGEFAIMGVLQDVATGIGTSVTQVGNLISAYALGVVIGTPLSVLVVARFSKKTQLLILIGWALLGNVATAGSDSYSFLLISRFSSGIPHGAYFGVASLVAASMFSASDRGKAVGLIMLGITTATLLGNPLAALIGKIAGWRLVFVIISAIELSAALLIVLFLANSDAESAGNPLNELGALVNSQVWLTLAVGAIGFGGVFSVISYVAPALTSTSNFNSSLLPYILFVFGLGMTLGNYVGGGSADKNLTVTIASSLAWSFVAMLLYTVLMKNTYTAFWGDRYKYGFSGAITGATDGRGW